jgi:hyaluronoglucosaminidase
LTDLGAGLHPQIDIFYTGPDVCSSEITTADAKDFAEAVHRAPLIWDNYPVNDLAMRPYMHIGPIRDREATLYQAVRGVVVNAMLQPEASKIPLLTWAAYLADPHGYEPEAAWKQALLQIGGAANSEALTLFAENSLHSCLRLPERPKLERLANAAAAFGSGTPTLSSSTLNELNQYLNMLDDACYALKNNMENLRLRQELLPWVEALDEWIWVGKRAMRLFEAIDGVKPFEHLARGVKNAIKEVQLHSKQTAGNALLPFAQAVLEHAENNRIDQADGNPALSRALE